MPLAAEPFALGSSEFDHSTMCASVSIIRCRTFIVALVYVSCILMAVGGLLVPSSSAQDPVGLNTAESDTESAFSLQASLRGTVGVPRGGFRAGTEGLGRGLHGYVGDWIGKRSLLVGVDIGFLSYGRSQQGVSSRLAAGARGPFEVRTSNNVFETHLTVRLQRRYGQVRPFLEGLVGVKYLFTRTTIEREGLVDASRRGTFDRTNFDDLALSGGVGAGLNIRLYQDSGGPSDRNRTVHTTQSTESTTVRFGVRALSLHLGVRYLLGQEAEYVTEGALEDINEDGRLDQRERNVRRSPTTSLQPQIGVTVQVGAV